MYAETYVHINLCIDFVMIIAMIAQYTAVSIILTTTTTTMVIIF